MDQRTCDSSTLINSDSDQFALEQFVRLHPLNANVQRTESKLIRSLSVKMLLLYTEDIKRTPEEEISDAYEMNFFLSFQGNQ